MKRIKGGFKKFHCYYDYKDYMTIDTHGDLVGIDLYDDEGLNLSVLLDRTDTEELVKFLQEILEGE